MIGWAGGGQKRGEEGGGKGNRGRERGELGGGKGRREWGGGGRGDFGLSAHTTANV